MIRAEKPDYLIKQGGGKQVSQFLTIIEIHQAYNGYKFTWFGYGFHDKGACTIKSVSDLFRQVCYGLICDMDGAKHITRCDTCLVYFPQYTLAVRTFF